MFGRSVWSAARTQALMGVQPLVGVFVATTSFLIMWLEWTGDSYGIKPWAAANEGSSCEVRPRVTFFSLRYGLEECCQGVV